MEAQRRGVNWRESGWMGKTKQNAAEEHELRAYQDAFILRHFGHSSEIILTELTALQLEN